MHPGATFTVHVIVRGKVTFYLCSLERVERDLEKGIRFPGSCLVLRYLVCLITYKSGLAHSLMFQRGNHMSFGSILHCASILAVTLASVLFGLVFVLRNQNRGRSAVKKSALSNLGILLHGISYPLAFVLMRNPWPVQAEIPLWLDALLVCAGALAGLCSVWLAFRASTQLGTNWSLTAKIMDGHKLVTSGVYGLVRHPIYTAMMLLLLAQLLIFSNWLFALVALSSFLAGTMIRIREEERLLREAFGDQYQQYASRVPALIPFLRCCCK